MRRKTMENLRRDTRLPAAVTQLELSSWFEALNWSFSIYHVNLRGGTSFALPVPLVSLDSSTPSSPDVLSLPTSSFPHRCVPLLVIRFHIARSPSFPSGALTRPSEQVSAARPLPGDAEASQKRWERTCGWLAQVEA